MELFLKKTNALSDETRVSLLKFIDKNGECCVCDLQSSFSMIQSRLSRHLKILREAGFLDVRREGRWAHYCVSASLDTFHSASLAEISNLDISLPNLVKACEIDRCTTAQKRLK